MKKTYLYYKPCSDCKKHPLFHVENGFDPVERACGKCTKFDLDGKKFKLNSYEEEPVDPEAEFDRAYSTVVPEHVIKHGTAYKGKIVQVIGMTKEGLRKYAKDVVDTMERNRV